MAAVSGPVLIGCALIVGRALSAPPADPSLPPVLGDPNVQIVAFFVPELGYAATVAYRERVSRAQAKADLMELARALGYERYSDLQRTEPGADKPLPLAYEVADGGATLGFRLSERAFSRETGTFKLEPFISAYRAYGRIDLEFTVGDLAGKRFAYRGIGDYDNQWVRIRHHGEGVFHSFAIEVLDPSFEQLDLPPFAPPVAPLQADEEGNKESLPKGVILTAVGAALVAAGLTFAVLVRAAMATRRRKARSRR